MGARWGLNLTSYALWARSASLLAAEPHFEHTKAPKTDTSIISGAGSIPPIRWRNIASFVVSDRRIANNPSPVFAFCFLRYIFKSHLRNQRLVEKRVFFFSFGKMVRDGVWISWASLFDPVLRRPSRSNLIDKFQLRLTLFAKIKIQPPQKPGSNIA